MRGLTSASGGVVAVLLLGAAPAVARFPPCTPARFVVGGPSAVVVGRARADVEAAFVAYAEVGTRVPLALGACTPVLARVAGTNKGTRVTAKYRAGTCPGVVGTLKLRALIDESCTTWQGTLKIGKGKPAPFTASRSRCGDGVWDPDNSDHEQCDGDESGVCGACMAPCQCVPPSTIRTTTTTTTTTSSTTTTLPPDAECGNGVREGDEECDGSPGAGGCPAGSRPGGVVVCAEDCTLDFADCSAPVGAGS